MVLAELGVSRASGPPWSTKTCAASSVPPTKSPDSTSTAKLALPISIYLLPALFPSLSPFSQPTCFCTHSGPTLHFPLSILPPFPCHFSPMKCWQGSHLFLPCSSPVPCLFWPQKRILPCPSTLSSDHNFECVSPQARSSPWLKVSIILFIRLGERREEERQIFK